MLFEGVTAALFPFRDIEKVLKVGQRKDKFTPLFDYSILQHHYPTVS